MKGRRGICKMKMLVKIIGTGIFVSLDFPRKSTIIKSVKDNIWSKKMGKKANTMEVKINVSERKRERIKELAQMLNMTVSALLVMMLDEVIKDKPVLDINHRRKSKRKKISEKKKSVEIEDKEEKTIITVSMYLDTTYHKHIYDSLKKCKYEYYLKEIVTDCIEMQLREFEVLLTLRNTTGKGKKGGTSVEDYVKEKASILGINSRQVERFYMGKYICQMVTKKGAGQFAWLEPHKMRELYGLPKKNEDEKEG